MSDISKLTIEGIEYDIKDEIARADIEDIRTELMGTSVMADEILDVLDGISSEDKIEAIIDNSGVLDSTEGTVEEKVEQVVEKAIDGDLWYIASGKITNLASGNYIFLQWNYPTLPKTDFSNVTNLSYAICSTQLEYIDFYINSGKCTRADDALSGNKKLKWIVGIDLSKVTNIYDLFINCNELENIQEPLNIANATKTGAAFNGCSKLKDIRFVAECIKLSIAFPDSSLLTAESIQSIFDGLAIVTTAQTLTLHRDAKILQSQVDSANAKGWTIAGGTVVSEEEYYG